MRNAIDSRTLGVRDFPIFYVEAAPSGAKKCEDETMANETNLTPEQMAARIAELEGRLARAAASASKCLRKEVFRYTVSVASRSLSTWSNGTRCSPTLPSFVSLSRPISRG